MVIDIIFLILLILAIWKGFNRGLIVGIFSFLAIIVGLAAAMKFSIVVSGWLANNTNIAAQWLPFISFLLVMIGVIILVRWLAALLQKAVELVMLGWLNRLGGIIFYVALYTVIFSIILFYATKMGIIKTETLAASSTYKFIQPLGPKAIALLGYVIPAFQNMFTDLQKFFDSITHKAA